MTVMYRPDSALLLEIVDFTTPTYGRESSFLIIHGSPPASLLRGLLFSNEISTFRLLGGEYITMKGREHGSRQVNLSLEKRQWT